MTRHLTAGLLTLAALTGALALLLGGPEPRALASWLGRHGGPEYPVWICWALAAPLLLATAWWVGRWSPWPWVAMATLHLLSLVVAAARFSRLMPAWGWVVLLVVVLVGLASIAGAVSARRTARG